MQVAKHVETHNVREFAGININMERVRFTPDANETYAVIMCATTRQVASGNELAIDLHDVNAGINRIQTWYDLANTNDWASSFGAHVFTAGASPVLEDFLILATRS